MDETLSSEARQTLVECVRLVILYYHAAKADPVSFHVGSRDLQRHFLTLPEHIFQAYGINYPDPVVGIEKHIYQNPKAFYELIASHNGWPHN